MMLQRMIAGLSVAALLAAMPAAAQDATRKPPGDTEQAIVDALTRTLDLLSRTFDQVMIYEVPELLPNGDIIIRRKRPKPDRPEMPAPPSPDDKIRL
jgi:hypothetical protein